MKIHKRTKHNTVQRQLRLCLALVYADHGKRTFVQHIETLPVQASQNHDDERILYATKISVVFPFCLQHCKCIF